MQVKYAGIKQRIDEDAAVLWGVCFREVNPKVGAWTSLIDKAPPKDIQIE